MSTSGPTARPSLRSRKQARARAALQGAAIDLVETRGYAAVSVEDICDAAEISRSTFFRYYGTKAAVFEADLVADDFRTLVDAEEEHSLPRLTALIAASYRGMDDATYDQERRRIHLLQTIPELRSSLAQELVRPLEVTLDYCCRILASDRDDPRVRLLTGAVFGALVTMQLPDSEGHLDLPPTKEQAAGRVEEVLGGLSEFLDPDALRPADRGGRTPLP